MYFSASTMVVVLCSVLVCVCGAAALSEFAQASGAKIPALAKVSVTVVCAIVAIAGLALSLRCNVWIGEQWIGITADGQCLMPGEHFGFGKVHRHLRQYPEMLVTWEEQTFSVSYAIEFPLQFVKGLAGVQPIGDLPPIEDVNWTRHHTERRILFHLDANRGELRKALDAVENELKYELGLKLTYGQDLIPLVAKLLEPVAGT